MKNNKNSTKLGNNLKAIGLTLVLFSVSFAGGYLTIKAGTRLVSVLNKNPIVAQETEVKKNQAVDMPYVEIPDPLEELNKPVKPRIIDLTDKKSTIILVYGPIMENGNDIATLIRGAGKAKKPIYLLIDSPGGSVVTGAAIVSAIEASQVPVYTVCLQVCASMAAMLHQYGTERYMVDRSILMFHNASGGFQGSLPQVASLFKTINRFVNKMFLNAAKRSGQDMSAFLSAIQDDLWIDAEDSLEKHYNDQIVSVIYNDKDALNPPSDTELQLRAEFKHTMNLMDIE